jgi:hypothetical protein
MTLGASDFFKRFQPLSHALTVGHKCSFMGIGP